MASIRAVEIDDFVGWSMQHLSEQIVFYWILLIELWFVYFTSETKHDTRASKCDGCKQMHNEHSKHEDTLKVIKLICLWSRDEWKELEMSWQNPWPVGLSLGGCPSAGTEEWGDWLSFCLWAQLDIPKRPPHPSDHPESERSASRWASLFLGHPDRHMKNHGGPKMLQQPQTTCSWACQSTSSESFSLHQPNRYHALDRAYRNNNCHYNYEP